jgi:hypothetical protein
MSLIVMLKSTVRLKKLIKMKASEKSGSDSMKDEFPQLEKLDVKEQNKILKNTVMSLYNEQKLIYRMLCRLQVQQKKTFASS